MRAINNNKMLSEEVHSAHSPNGLRLDERRWDLAWYVDNAYALGWRTIVSRPLWPTPMCQVATLPPAPPAALHGGLSPLKCPHWGEGSLECVQPLIVIIVVFDDASLAVKQVKHGGQQHVDFGSYGCTLC
jgi:hypothetical protein